MRLLGLSKPMEQLREMITKVARSQAPVHISGESGTGKELVARLIHDSGPRRAGPFVPVNCGAIPSELMESELFGHKKGSFTGAATDKEGLIRSAEGGTLFLDEVADLPLHMQVKLLRVIQEKAVRPVGELREVPVDVRILSATHRKLDELVKAGRFREDLYYRVNVIELHVPHCASGSTTFHCSSKRSSSACHIRSASRFRTSVLRRFKNYATIRIPATCANLKIFSSGP
jgi:two-component system response regulator PilR (NtrC family)